MTTEHDRLQDLVLNLEELEGEARERAERHYQDCESCRRILDAIREVERQVREMPEIPYGSSDPLAPLDRESREAAERSRRDILGRIDPARSTGSSARLSRWVGPRRGGALLLAALVAAVLLWPRAGVETHIRNFSVSPAAQARSAIDGSWGEGDAFVLQFELTRAGYPLVIHLGESGRPELLHPERSDLPLEAASPETLHRLPPPGSEEAWVFEGSNTRETFLLCTSSRAEMDMEALLGELRRRAAAAGSRAAALAAVEEHLRNEVGPTARRDLRLRP